MRCSTMTAALAVALLMAGGAQAAGPVVWNGGPGAWRDPQVWNGNGSATTELGSING